MKNTTSNHPQPIEPESLREKVRHFVEHAKWNTRFVPDPEQSEWKKNTDLETDAILQVLEEAIDAVIGEDDPNIHAMLAIENQNHLRDFQRFRKNKILGKESP